MPQQTEMETLRAQIVQEMELNSDSLNTTSDPDGAISKRMALMCYKFGISPLDLVVEWMAFSVNIELSSISLKVMDSFESSLRLSHKERQPQTIQRDMFHSAPEVPALLSGEKTASYSGALEIPSVVREDDALDPSFRSPEVPSRSKRFRPSAQNTPLVSPSHARYESRTRHQDSLATHNAHLPTASASSGGRVHIELLSKSEESEEAFRYQFQPLDSVSKILDSRMVEMARHIRASSPADLQPFSPIQQPSQSEVVVFGRVCRSSEASEGPVSEVFLQGDVELSSGASVLLDYSEVSEFVLFDGEIVVVQGFNPDGSTLIAKHIYTHGAGSKAVLPEGFSEELSQRKEGEPLSIVCAIGPFNLCNTDASAPLQDLLSVVQATPPDLLILCGPFVHEAVDDVSLRSAVDPSAVFVSIVAQVEEALQHIPTRVLIVPSTQDFHCVPVFPQPAFQERSPLRSSDPNKVMFVPNPSIVRIDDVVVAVSTVDIFHALFSTQRVRSGGNLHRYVQVASSLVAQQSFYPMFPPAIGDRVDIIHSSKYSLPITPDLLLLSTKLNPFVKDWAEKDMLVLNPGRISMGKCSYAHLTVHPKTSSPQTMDFVGRSRVEIQRI